MKLYFSILFLLLFSLNAEAQLRVSLESGAAFTQYNDVRVPNGDQNEGTLFSFRDDFEDVNPTVFFRAELAYLIEDRHMVELTAAPLTIEYDNATLDNIDFAGTNFSGDGINGRYEFNTYRATYRYRLLNRDKLKFGIGASLLVRDARIALSQGDLEADDTDLGFVPLVSFELSYTPEEKLSLLLKGDALVGPQGRAEDIFAGVLYNVLGERLRLKAGYRLIEGGADVDQVYNFAFIHFADVGAVLSF